MRTSQGSGNRARAATVISLAVLVASPIGTSWPSAIREPEYLGLPSSAHRDASRPNEGDCATPGASGEGGSQGPAASFLSAARARKVATFRATDGSGENHDFEVRPYVSSVLSAEDNPPIPGASQPYNLAAPIHVIRGISIDGEATLVSFVRCNFLSGTLFLNGGIKLQFGELLGSRVQHGGREKAPIQHRDPEASVLQPSHAPVPGGSIAIVKHLWCCGENAVANDPVNVLFYDVLGDTINHMMKDEAGWKRDQCGNPEFLFFFDEQHGGDDQWQEQDTNWDKRGDLAICAVAQRFHLRQYISTAPAGDNHQPGFQGFAGMPAHKDSVFHQEANPQEGQDQLVFDIAGNHHVVDHHVELVANHREDCSWCKNWGNPEAGHAFVDLFEVSGGTPGGAQRNCVDVQIDEFMAGQFPWLSIQCIRPPMPNPGPGGGAARCLVIVTENLEMFVKMGGQDPAAPPRPTSTLKDAGVCASRTVEALAG